MDWITEISALEALYGAPVAAATRKVAHEITPAYRPWLEAARFCVLSTVGPEGTDGSPRGDDGPVLRLLDAKTIALPDWRGNNRIDSLRNILRDGRVSLMVMISGNNTVIRVNGRARLTADGDLCARFARDGATPRSVIVITVDEIYFQCARALMRARIWDPSTAPQGLPSPGEMLAAMSDGAEGGPDYDAAWPARAARTLW